MSKVAGYRPLSDEVVAAVNGLKEAEERLLRVVDAARDDDKVDQRWLAVARTHIEQGFMALNRSMFRPTRIALPEDAAA